MPNEPRIPAEPTLDELSAYLDHELDAPSQAHLADHLAGCDDCRARLEGLRQAAHAIRALPMETPARTFTIPAQRRPSFRWAPVGWLGAGAAAMLIVVVGVTQLHFQGPAGTASTSSFNGGLAAAPANGSAARNQKGAIAPLAAPLPSTQQFDAQSSGAAANGSTVSDSTNGSRRLILDTDRSSYATNGRMRVTVQLVGSPSTSLNSGDQGLTLTLVHNGQGVALNPVGVESGNGTPIFGGWYDLASFPLSAPRAGDYRLEATWMIPDGSGRVLQASIPVQIAG